MSTVTIRTTSEPSLGITTQRSLDIATQRMLDKLAVAYNKADIAVKKSEEQRDAIKAQIKSLMGEMNLEKATTKSHSVIYRKTLYTVFDERRFAAENEHLYSLYQIRKERPYFRVK